MATKFEDLLNGMINVSFGAAAVAAEKGKGFLDDLNAKGAEVRKDSSTPDFARSLSDAFEQAGGTFTEVTERLSQQGETAADRVLDELIALRASQLDAAGRAEFTDHVAELVKHADDGAVKVAVESEEDPAQAEDVADVSEAADNPVSDGTEADAPKGE